MQQYFLQIASPIIGNVLSIIEACRASGIRVIFTRHGHKDINKDGGMLGKRFEPKSMLAQVHRFAFSE